MTKSKGAPSGSSASAIEKTEELKYLIGATSSYEKTLAFLQWRVDELERSYPFLLNDQWPLLAEHRERPDLLEKYPSIAKGVVERGPISTGPYWTTDEYIRDVFQEEKGSAIRLGRKAKGPDDPRSRLLRRGDSSHFIMLARVRLHLLNSNCLGDQGIAKMAFDLGSLTSEFRAGLFEKQNGMKAGSRKAGAKAKRLEFLARILKKHFVLQPKSSAGVAWDWLIDCARKGLEMGLEADLEAGSRKGMLIIDHSGSESSMAFGTFKNDFRKIRLLAMS